MEPREAITVDQAHWELEQIKARGAGDPEINHIEADEILCRLLTSLGYNKVVATYDAISKWYA